MGQMLCANCNNRMSNTAIPNRVENFLIETWIEELKGKKYRKVLLDEISKQQKMHEEDPTENGPIDPWFAICSELGRDVWICPKCQTMHIFSKKQPCEVEKVYKLMKKSEWYKK